VRGRNSFVAPYSNYQYQIDLCFFADLENHKFKVGMICVGIFSKFAAVVQIKSTSEGDEAAGLFECIAKMLKKPKMIYTDDEQALQTAAMKNYFNDNKITHYVTRHHAAFGERFIRTFKKMFYKRIENEEQTYVYIVPQWTDYIDEIMIAYIYKKKNIHSGTGFTPDDARRATNQL
jgi:hypothetical protein